MSWKRSLTQARAPNPPASRTLWSGPCAASGRRASRIAHPPAIRPPRTYPAANPITAPVRPATSASAGQSSSTHAGPVTVSSAYVSYRSLASGIAGTIHQARAKGRAAISEAAIARLKSFRALSRSSA